MKPFKPSAVKALLINRNDNKAPMYDVITDKPAKVSSEESIRIASILNWIIYLQDVETAVFTDDTTLKKLDASDRLQFNLKMLSRIEPVDRE